jgi:hypothetical protein
VASSLDGSTNVSVTTADPVLAVVGGLGCDYSYGKAGAYPTSEVQVSVAPAAIDDSTELANSLTTPLCTRKKHVAECWATATVGGWWYSLDVTPNGVPSATALLASFDAITADLETVLNGATAPAAAIAKPLNCATASTSADALTGSRPMPYNDNEPYNQSEAILAAALLLAAPTTCTATTSGWTVTVYPGSAAEYEQCAHSVSGTARPLTIRGVRTAVALASNAADGAQVCATDGESSIEASNPIQDQGDPLTASEITSLGRILGRVFKSAATSMAPWSSSLAAATSSPPQPLAAGSCKKLIDVKVASAALGTGKYDNADIYDPLLSTVGGIDCEYVIGDHEIFMTVAPAAIADPTELAASLAPTTCGVDPMDDDLTACSATVAKDGWWYNVSVDALDPDKGAAAMTKTFSAVTGALETTLSASTAPGRVPAQKPFDCSTAAIAGVPVTGSRAASAPLSGPGNEISAAAFLLAGPSTCDIGPIDGVKWSLTVYPDGASSYPACTHLESGAGEPNRSISVPGVTTALALSTDGSGSEVCATDGKSTVLTVWDRPDDPAWTLAARTTLGSLLVPVFAAIK